VIPPWLGVICSQDVVRVGKHSRGFFERHAVLACIVHGFPVIPLEVAEKYRRHVQWARSAHPALSGSAETDCSTSNEPILDGAHRELSSRIPPFVARARRLQGDRRLCDRQRQRLPLDRRRKVAGTDRIVERYGVGPQAQRAPVEGPISESGRVVDTGEDGLRISRY
jgi:hypothetical protein